jgi:hypothetical protein
LEIAEIPAIVLPVRTLKRFALTTVGVGLLLAGVALMVLPGPGLLLIVAGLGVLATEYVWAKNLLVRAKDRAEQAQQEAVAGPWRTAASVMFALGLISLGVAMLLVNDVAWPLWDSIGDAVWGPVTGTIFVLTGLILLTTTLYTLRQQRRRPSR